MGSETKIGPKPPLVFDSHQAPRRDHPLRRWRLRQRVSRDGKCFPMRLQDVEEVYAVPSSTWHCWERWPDEAGFRRPDDANMQRIFEITAGEITPDAFYPLDEWRAGLPEPELRKTG